MNFESTGEAYDATQCDDAIKSGDLLIIESEEVVGLADTWPVSVTATHGHLHTIAEGETFHAWANDRHITAEQVEIACAVARSRGWSLHPAFA